MGGGGRLKLWCLYGLLAIAWVIALVAVGVIDGPLGPDHPRKDVCAQGDALRTARLLDKAEETYAKASDECPQHQQVERSRSEADAFFAAADLYALAAPVPPAEPKPGETGPSEAEESAAKNNSRKAINEFASGLAIDPFDTDANLALDLELKKELVSSQVRCKTAAALADTGLLALAGAALAPGLVQGNELCETTVAALGDKRAGAAASLAEAKSLSDESAARDAYAKALRENANLTAAQTELEGSLDDESHLDRVGSWLAGIPGTLETMLKWFVPLVVGLLLLALLAWIAIRESAARWSWPRRLFQGLGEHPGLSFFYKAAVPDIDFHPFEGKGEADLEGADFATLLRAELVRPAGREPAFAFDRVATGIEPDAKDNVTMVDLVNEIPATKLLGSVFSVISKLFRRRSVLLTGYLTPPVEKKGAGVFLAVESNDKAFSRSVTLWEEDYDPKPGLEGAARWLVLIPAAGVWARWHLADAQDPTKRLEVDSWKADALFQSAQAWQLKEDRDRAEALYTEALEREAELLPAAHNLSVIEMRKRHYRRAQQRVRKLRRTLEDGTRDGLGPEEMKENWPTLDTGSLYTLMLALAYPEIDTKGKPEDGDLSAAVETGQELVERLAEQLETVSKAKKRETRKEREKRLELEEKLELAEPAAVVVLASLAIRKAGDGDKQTAIDYAIAPEPKVDEVTREQLRKRVRDLEPWDLIHGYAEKAPHILRRAHYNLACYFTTLSEYARGEAQAQCRKRALKSLEAALVGGGLVGWAGKDPSLAPLKAACPKEFEGILKERTIEPHPAEDKPDPEPDGDKKPPEGEEPKTISALLKALGEKLRKRITQ